MQSVHKPVLLEEVLQVLEPKENENFIDCTLGGAGHSREILKRIGRGGKLLAFDLDKLAIDRAGQELNEFKDRLILINKSFVNLAETVKELNFGPISGILLDLGWSMDQIVSSGKGFTFQKDEPLDMRFDENQHLTAKYIVNNYSQEEIERILWENAQERFSRKIASQIVKARKNKQIETTFELKNIIYEVVWKTGKIDPATKTFQALRIEVNDEFGAIQRVLQKALHILTASGKLAVITFHSLEDALVKQFFKNANKENLINLINKKVIKPKYEEVRQNRSSRSAKLRAVEKI